MKCLFSLLFVFSLLTAGLPATRAQDCSAKTGLWPGKKALEYADKQLKKMSTDEKIGQLIHIGVNAKYANQDSSFFRELKRQVTENKIGGILFFAAPIYETTILANRMQQFAGLPLLMSLDAETGIGMRFDDATNLPWAMAIGATGDPGLARRAGTITGREARAIGIRQVFAPVFDVNNNAANPVINVRSFGEDPQEVARFGVAFSQGIQGQCVIATAKHFPGHGDTNTDSHRGIPVIDLPRERLDAVELVPFKSAIRSGTGAVMVAHIALSQLDSEVVKPLPSYLQGDSDTGAEIVDAKTIIPATLSYNIQTGVLRKDLGFNGLIVSDAMSMSGLTVYFSQEEAGVRAILAGTDILEKPADADAMIKGLRTAVASGRITAARLDESVRRQLAWKYELGLTKDRLTAVDAIDRIVAGSESEALADEIATRAITLVRSEPGAVPLDKNARIAVLGVSNGTDGPGTMSSFVNSLRSGGIGLTSAYIQENSTPEQITAAVKAMGGADIVVLALYGRVRTGSKNSTALPAGSMTALRGLIASQKRVVGISFGNPYLLETLPDLKTHLVAYGDMPSLQRAAARAVLGTQDITGRLPISLPGLYPRGTGIQLMKKR